MPPITMREYQCEIMALGLRNLLSTGLLPIRKAFVKFNLKSVLPPEQGDAVENIKTKPKEGGSNPNLNSVISFEIEIPEDPLFCPRMTCDVYDQLYFEGMTQPHLGTFTLPFKEIIEKQQEEAD